MTNEEVAKCIAYINSSWGNKPLDQMGAKSWGSQLAPYPNEEVLAVLEELLRTWKWRPPLSEILKPLAPASDVKSAEAAFETVWGQIGKRHRLVSVLEQRAVKRLGGWPALGKWELDKRHWHLRAFREVYGDLVDTEASLDLRAIASGVPRERALAPAPEEVPAPTATSSRPIEPSRIDELAAGLFAKLRHGSTAD